MKTDSRPESRERRRSRGDRKTQSIQLRLHSLPCTVLSYKFAGICPGCLTWSVSRSHSRLLFTREERTTLDFTDCRISFSLCLPRPYFSLVLALTSETSLFRCFNRIGNKTNVVNCVTNSGEIHGILAKEALLFSLFFLSGYIRSFMFQSTRIYLKVFFRFFG